MTKLAFVDLETTGLDPKRHEIWDVGIITVDTEAAGKGRPDPYREEFQCFLPVTLATADSMALTVGRFYERHPHFKGEPHTDTWGGLQQGTAQMEEDRHNSVWSPAPAAHKIARLLAGRHLVGNVVSFDAGFLDVFLRANGAAPNWHYHLVDCEALVAGALGRQPPWKSTELSVAAGVETPDHGEHHTALADARWAERLYLAVMAGTARMHAETLPEIDTDELA